MCFSRKHRGEGKIYYKRIVHYQRPLVLCLLVLFGLQKAGVTGLRMPFALLLVSQLYNYYFQEYVRAIKQLKVYTWNLIISTCMIIFFSIALVYGMGLGLQGLLLAHFLGYFGRRFFCCVLYEDMAVPGQESDKRQDSKRDCKNIRCLLFRIIFHGGF